MPPGSGTSERCGGVIVWFPSPAGRTRPFEWRIHRSWDVPQRVPMRHHLQRPREGGTSQFRQAAGLRTMYPDVPKENCHADPVVLPVGAGAEL